MFLYGITTADNGTESPQFIPDCLYLLMITTTECGFGKSKNK